jgi:hypothetical protein
VVQEYAKPSWAIFSDSSTGDDALQRDRVTVLFLQAEQAGTIPAGVSTGKMANPQSFYPDRHSVGVVGVAVLRNEQSIDVRTHPLITSAWAHQAFQVLLVVGLANYFEVLRPLEERYLDAIMHPGGSLVFLRRYGSGLPALAAL